MEDVSINREKAPLLSAQAHDPSSSSHSHSHNKQQHHHHHHHHGKHGEQHPVSKIGEVTKSIVYGGLDGLVSIFVAVVISVLTDAPPATVLVLSVAKLFAGSFSMGVGDYLSTKADVDYAKGERAREEWEFENFAQGEIEEMVEVYKSKGYTDETSRRIVAILSKKHEMFVDIMMVEELGIPAGVALESPWKNGLANFLSFLVFGLLPVLPFIVWLIGDRSSEGHPALWHNAYVPLYISGALYAVALVVLGLAKVKIGGQEWWKSILQTAAGGVAAAVVGGGLSYLVFHFTGAVP